MPGWLSEAAAWLATSAIAAVLGTIRWVRLFDRIRARRLRWWLL